MNVDEAMRRFAVGDEFPREALQWALDNWDAASPRLIAKLRAYAGGAPLSEADLGVLFYVIHLCGEKREFPRLCPAVRSDRERRNVRRLVRRNDHRNSRGHPDQPLRWRRRTSETRNRSPRGRRVLPRRRDRGARLSGTRQGHPRRRRNAGLPLASGEGDAATLGERVWQAWAFAIAQLGYEPLRGEVARVFSKRWIEPVEASLDEFYEDLQLARNDPLGMAAFSASGIEPYGSSVESLERWCSGEDDEGEGAYDDVDAPRRRFRSRAA